MATLMRRNDGILGYERERRVRSFGRQRRQRRLVEKVCRGRGNDAGERWISASDATGPSAGSVKSGDKGSLKKSFFPMAIGEDLGERSAEKGSVHTLLT